MRGLAILGLALAVAAPADAFILGNRMQVTTLGGADFAVAYTPRAEESDYWCAAGTYVTQRLGMDSRTRLYRQSPEPRKRNQGISFTLDKARSTGSTGITIYGGPQDGGISAGSAYQYCFDYEFDRFGFGD